MFTVDEPARFRLMFSGELAGSDCSELTRAEDAFSELEESIALGVSRGELRSDVFESYALSAWSLAHGLSSLILDKRVGGDKNREALRKLAVIVGRTLIDGVAPKLCPAHRFSCASVSRRSFTCSCARCVASALPAQNLPWRPAAPFG